MLPAAKRWISHASALSGTPWKTPRLENWLISRWPGAARALNANILPNLGGRLVGTMSIPDQLEMGLYLEDAACTGTLPLASAPGA